MCRLWSLWALSASSWVAAWVGGWATGWQQGAARNASTMWPSPTPRMRTPVLTLHVQTLRLRIGARSREQNGTPHLRLCD